MALDTPNYIKALLVPNGKKPAGRRIWGIDLELFWLPFLTATNTMGDTAIPSDALGAPLRLAYNQDGSVKFSKTGRPVLKVAKDIADSVRLIRENFATGLQVYATQVSADNPDGYKAQLEMAKEAGAPITAKDSAQLSKAMAQQLAEAMVEAGKGKGKRERQLEENMRYYVQLITRAQEEERKRIARELHDEVAPSLLLLTQRLDAISSSTKPKPPPSLKERIEDLRNHTIEALESLRRCAQDLRPRILDDLGLIPALEWVTEELVKNYGINARVEVEGTEQTLPAEVQLLLFRIAQEALSNIRKHAGASMAVVKLEFGDDSISMTISDNGRGFALPPRVEDLASTGKLGIIGMCERARLLRGSLEIKSELTKGTQVVTKVPLPV